MMKALVEPLLSSLIGEASSTFLTVEESLLPSSKINKLSPESPVRLIDEPLGLAEKVTAPSMELSGSIPGTRFKTTSEKASILPVDSD